MRSEAEVSAMACPVCRVPLAMSDRQGIEIDYCPQCRGVWLDRGELDKIIERANADTARVAPSPQAPMPQAPPAQAPGGYPPAHPGYAPPHAQPSPWGQQPGYGHGYGGKRKKSFLEDLFD